MRRIALDTSVLVAAVLEAHPAHVSSHVWVTPSRERELHAAWHAMAEAWTTLGRMPVNPRLTADAIEPVLDRLRALVTFNVSTSATYGEALRRCTRRGLASAVIYDALHLVSAREAGADALVTLNPRDFRRVWENGDPEIVEPPMPPGTTPAQPPR